MQFAAQPPGTAAAVILTNRGEDPELIASNALDFYVSCKSLLHSRPLAGSTIGGLHLDNCVCISPTSRTSHRIPLRDAAHQRSYLYETGAG